MEQLRGVKRGSCPLDIHITLFKPFQGKYYTTQAPSAPTFVFCLTGCLTQPPHKPQRVRLWDLMGTQCKTSSTVLSFVLPVTGLKITPPVPNTTICENMNSTPYPSPNFGCVHILFVLFLCAFNLQEPKINNLNQSTIHSNIRLVTVENLQAPL